MPASRRSGEDPRRFANKRSRSPSASHSCSQSLQRMANGSARRRASAISAPHSKQSPMTFYGPVKGVSANEAARVRMHMELEGSSSPRGRARASARLTE